jgi:hypothetical protein
LTLTCLADEACAVYFEPESAEHMLAPDDPFAVEFRAYTPGSAEVSWSQGGISVAGWDGATVRAWNREGLELRL